MKKEYINPEMEIVTAEVEQMLATSPSATIDPSDTVDPGSVESSEFRDLIEW